MLFSHNTKEQTRSTLSKLLKIPVSGNIDTYLGLPTVLGKSLSYAGRATLIKTVAQVIPAYMISSFIIPKSICKKMKGLAARFWWGIGRFNGRSGPNFAHTKWNGGLGFRNMKAFNEALLVEQAWRLHTNLSYLVARFLKAKYYPKTNVLNASLGSNPNYLWCNIKKNIWIINRGSCWEIGNGKKINISKDN